jgi:hypothetical protein
MHLLAGGFEGRSHDGENIRRFYPGSLGDYFFGDSGLVYDSRQRAGNGAFGGPDPAVAVVRRRKILRRGSSGTRARRADMMMGRAYGVATASDACSPASATQIFLRCSPLIAPVTLSTFPAGHDASCTKAIS